MRSFAVILAELPDAFGIAFAPQREIYFLRLSLTQRRKGNTKARKEELSNQLPT
jgi:hypothetical protein